MDTKHVCISAGGPPVHHVSRHVFQLEVHQYFTYQGMSFSWRSTSTSRIKACVCFSWRCTSTSRIKACVCFSWRSTSTSRIKAYVSAGGPPVLHVSRHVFQLEVHQYFTYKGMCFSWRSTSTSCIKACVCFSWRSTSTSRTVSSSCAGTRTSRQPWRTAAVRRRRTTAASPTPTTPTTWTRGTTSTASSPSGSPSTASLCTSKSNMHHFMPVANYLKV